MYVVVTISPPPPADRASFLTDASLPEYSGFFHACVLLLECLFAFDVEQQQLQQHVAVGENPGDLGRPALTIYSKFSRFAWQSMGVAGRNK